MRPLTIAAIITGIAIMFVLAFVLSTQPTEAERSATATWSASDATVTAIVEKMAANKVKIATLQSVKATLEAIATQSP
jgi:hypothetical protein